MQPRYKFFALAAILCLANVLLLTITACAAPAGTVSLTPLYDQVVNPTLFNIFMGLASLVMGWAFYLLGMLAKHLPPILSAHLQTKAQDLLSRALYEGVQAAMHEVENAETLHSDVEVKGAVQRYAAQYALDHAGDAANHLGLGPDELAQKALAFLPHAPIALTTAVETAPLAPVAGAKSE